MGSHRADFASCVGSHCADYIVSHRADCIVAWDRIVLHRGDCIVRLHLADCIMRSHCVDCIVRSHRADCMVRIASRGLPWDRIVQIAS